MFDWLLTNWEAITGCIAALGLGGIVTKIAIVGKLAKSIVNLFHKAGDTVLDKWAFNLGKKVTTEGRKRFGSKLWELKVENNLEKALHKMSDSFIRGLNSDE